VIVTVVVVATTLGTVLPQMPELESTSSLLGLAFFLSSISFDGGKDLQTPSTPKNDALYWLAANDNLGTYSDEKKIQRYGLATLYYSTNGERWRRSEGWLSNSDECEWYSSFVNGLLCSISPFKDFSWCKSSCSDNGSVVQLSLYDNNLEGTIPEEVALLSNSLGKYNNAVVVWLLQPFSIKYSSLVQYSIHNSILQILGWICPAIG